MPGAERRRYPARWSSLWLATSASAGSSLRERTNRLDMRRGTGNSSGDGSTTGRTLELYHRTPAHPLPATSAPGPSRAHGGSALPPLSCEPYGSSEEPSTRHEG